MKLLQLQLLQQMSVEEMITTLYYCCFIPVVVPLRQAVVL